MNKILKCGLPVVLTVILLSGCYFFPTEEESLAPPIQQPSEVLYETVEVKKDDIVNETKCTAYAIPIKKVNLSFLYRGGYLKEVHVSKGEKVKKGDILAELDNESILDNLKKTRLTLKNDNIAYEEFIKNGDIDIQLAEYELKKLEEELTTKKAIKGEYSLSDIKSVESRIEKQKLIVQQRKYSYETNKINKKQKIEMTNYNLEQQEKELEKSKIVATIDGEVSYINDIAIGEYMNARKTFITVVDDAKLQLEYEGSKSKDFKKGMKIVAKINKEEIEGEVTLTVNDVPYEEMEFYKDKVRFSLDKLPEDIRMNQSIGIRAVLEEAHDVIVIERNNVNSFGVTKYVRILDDNDMPISVNIQTGIENSTQVEVVKGLKVGDRIIK